MICPHSWCCATAWSRKHGRCATKGPPMENILWHLMTHVVNHGTQHRSKAAILLTGYGYSPGAPDLIVFLRERGSTKMHHAAGDAG